MSPNARRGYTDGWVGRVSFSLPPFLKKSENPRTFGELSFTRIVRYIEANPVSAGLAATPEDWPWSSATKAS